MNIVADTNILVSGLLSPFGACAEIVRLISSSQLTLAFDARILSEYKDVLNRPKFGFDKDKIEALLDHIIHSGRTVASSSLPIPLPDPDDEPFLEVAIAGEPICLVSGNYTHFPAKLCHGVKVFSPNEFLTFYKRHKKVI